MSSDAYWGFCLEVSGRRALERQQSGARKLGASSAIHRSFERFKVVDLSLRLADAPTTCDRISDGVNIPAQSAGKALFRVESRLLCVLRPSGKLASVGGSPYKPRPADHGFADQIRASTELD
jgi:hypothetical protein